VHLLLLGRDQELLPSPRPMEPEAITALCPLHQAGVLRMERQPPCVEKGCDHGARRLDSGQAFCHHDHVIGIPGDPVAFPQLFGQSIAGDIPPQWAAHAALGGPSVVWGRVPCAQ
jgi:hypothetical protein